MSTQRARSPLLELIRLLNGGRRLSADAAVQVIDEGPPRSLLVLAPKVAETLLRSPHLRQTSIWTFYSRATGMQAADLPVLAETLQSLPMSLEGAGHRSTRLALAPLYRRAEGALDEWIGDLCAEFVRDLSSRRGNDILKASSDFSDRLGRGILARELGLKPDDFPPLPAGLITLLPSVDELKRHEQRLATTRDIIRSRLAALGRSAEDYWPLATIMVMNRDSTQAALLPILSALRKGEFPTDARSALTETTPVSLLQCRTFNRDVTIAGFKYRQDDLVHVSPHLLHQREMPPTAPNFSFGSGPHFCPGMRIALKALDALIMALRSDPLPEGALAQPPPLLRQIVISALPKPRLMTS